MYRALFGNEPLIVFVTIYCFLFFNFEFYFSSEALHKGCLFVCIWGNLFANVLYIGCWKPSGKFVTGGKRVLATFWQISFKVSEVISKPLTNSSEGIDNFCK
jgi:hypothetical protein